MGFPNPFEGTAQMVYLNLPLFVLNRLFTVILDPSPVPASNSHAPFSKLPLDWGRFVHRERSLIHADHWAADPVLDRHFDHVRFTVCHQISLPMCFVATKKKPRMHAAKRFSLASGP